MQLRAQLQAVNRSESRPFVVSSGIGPNGKPAGMLLRSGK